MFDRRPPRARHIEIAARQLACQNRCIKTHLSEVHKMPEAGVQVRLLAKSAYALEVGVIDVRIHAEQALEDHSYHLHEIRRELGAVHLRENSRIVQLQQNMDVVSAGSC